MQGLCFVVSQNILYLTILVFLDVKKLLQIPFTPFICLKYILTISLKVSIGNFHVVIET